MGGGGGVGVGGSHIRVIRVCAARKPPPHFFGLDCSERPPPPFKNIHLFVPLFRPGLLQKTPLLKYTFLCYFKFRNTSRFSVRGRFESPPPRIFSEAPLPKPPPGPQFSNSGRHIYTTFLYEYPPPTRIYLYLIDVVLSTNALVIHDIHDCMVHMHLWSRELFFSKFSIYHKESKREISGCFLQRLLSCRSSRRNRTSAHSVVNQYMLPRRSLGQARNGTNSALNVVRDIVHSGKLVYDLVGQEMAQILLHMWYVI